MIIPPLTRQKLALKSLLWYDERHRMWRDHYGYGDHVSDPEAFRLRCLNVPPLSADGEPLFL